MYIESPGGPDDDRLNRMSFAASKCMEVMSVDYSLTLDEVITVLASILDQYCVMTAESGAMEGATLDAIRRSLVHQFFLRITVMNGRPQWSLVEHDLSVKPKPTKG